MRNPWRRNRKIGKTQGGRVKDGRAGEKSSRLFTNSIWHQISKHEVKEGYIIIKQNPSSQFYHPCNAVEISKLIQQLPKKITRDLRAVILRRPSNNDVKRGIEARRLSNCIILNAFPRSNRVAWGKKEPLQSTINHYALWCDRWILENEFWYQAWTPGQVKRYYLYHLLLHELGHIHQPEYHSLKRRESFAEDFALTWARKLNVI